MSARNTPEAPTLRHCHSCGSTRLHSHGEVTDFRGRPTCDDCRIGISDQEHDRSADPVRALQATRVAHLHSAVDALQAQIPTVSVQVFHPLSGVAVIMPNGYRWHLSANSDLAVRATSQLTCCLFTPSRDPFPGLPPLLLPDVEDLPSLLGASGSDGPIGALIEADVLARAEIDCFDPDALLANDIPD